MPRLISNSEIDLDFYNSSVKSAICHRGGRYHPSVDSFASIPFFSCPMVFHDNRIIYQFTDIPKTYFLWRTTLTVYQSWLQYTMKDDGSCYTAFQTKRKLYTKLMAKMLKSILFILMCLFTIHLTIALFHVYTHKRKRRTCDWNANFELMWICK